MYGRDIGALNIYFSLGGGVYEELLWSRNGTIGPQWHYGQVRFLLNLGQCRL